MYTAFLNFCVIRSMMHGLAYFAICAIIAGGGGEDLGASITCFGKCSDQVQAYTCRSSSRNLAAVLTRFAISIWGAGSVAAV